MLEGMIHKLASYRVRLSEVSRVKEAISELITHVRKSEWGTLTYEVYQLQDEISFLHVMTFEDAQSEKDHQQSAHTRKFAEVLKPLCEEPPRLSNMNLAGSIEQFSA